MTERDDAQGGSPALAALAIQVSKLHRGVDSLTKRADALTRTQQEHAVVLEGIAELRDQVEKVLTILGEDDEDSSEPWFWLTMDDQAREYRYSELYDWVETVLRVQYPGYLTGQILPCWPNHPEARWELAWLYQLWHAAYLSKRPALKDAADWHDRWSPGVVRRLGHLMARCESACQRDHPADIHGAPHK
jgi:hypothetical protein